MIDGGPLAAQGFGIINRIRLTHNDHTVVIPDCRQILVGKSAQHGHLVTQILHQRQAAGLAQQ